METKFTSDLMVLLFLTFCWICLSLYKQFINSKNNYIQKNTIGYWLLICISIYIGLYGFKHTRAHTISF